VRARLALAAALLAVPLLAACGPTSPTDALRPKTHLDVGSPDLVTYKAHTRIPDCPKTSGGAVDGGMPSVTLPCLGGGREIDTAGLRGPMIVNLWAGWCTDCRKEMPALATFARTHPAVKVLGIDYVDTQPGAALELAAQSGVGYPLAADPSAKLDTAGSLPHIAGLPFTVFLNADGKIVHVEAGAMSTPAAVAAAAHKYLGVSG
jgi:thiol-disulfide isomerase/thioredoxin